MPRRRRTAKRRRLDIRAELECWETMFKCGFAFDGDLDAYGYSGNAPDEVTAEAWQRLGSRFIAEHGRETDTGKRLWALDQFGEPHAAA
jgi:hypothetical protein